MKLVNFKTVSIKNFLSVGRDPVTVDFSTGLHIITGLNKDKEDRRNGVGKSTIADAIHFAVFGTTIRDLKKEHIVNLITVINAYARQCVSGIYSSISSKCNSVSITHKEKSHFLRLTSSRDDIEPLTIVLDDVNNLSYTVPAGKYFVGYISWTDNRYTCQINGINMFGNNYAGTSAEGSGSFNPFIGPITLYAGMTVGRHGTGGACQIAGVEYDL